MATERIEVLKSILLDLHNGASAESVQELSTSILLVCPPSRSA